MTVSETPTLPELRQTGWQPVCALRHLAPERGAAAIFGEHQVALFRLVDDRVLAVDQHDPFSDAYVMSRGIVGSRAVDGVEVPTVASPMYKQVFDLTTGRCLDPAGKVPARGLPADLRAFPVRVVDGVVEVELPDGPVEP
ncbi:nitrite reductase small subunit NirD [Cellulomonas fimi]|uniref:Nitrite reductase (NAD(P)H), small subunit n=1 Tax=Cellulomonas fimi (strain ATCC 484 / DSM 20113 / JCM 1341 / CCUG 24087 / LMG 16345 / NBRC 15513 / NCIMB 8980 / NCTC 7547 / NRS-133) TaxID=590998 RepID=F4H448_CELFA|nr:nitrite reductase small subunit NirD [Cellulomonas fimi]AEE45400.1 nitrite reductase (NAD(P)H), small subunit [Cellulomonas fimi ATCC 484]NNH06847.1 nitrite reductase small subunit NirD [Cellulomonas fimi]VEH29263.1 Nitrite reductase [NAD(P)H] small subunit [Cellulomonas fimi]